MNKIIKYFSSFLIVIMLIGFFGQSVLNVFIPTVLTSSVSVGIVEKTITFEGSFNFPEVIVVKLDSDVIIDQFQVRTGQQIEEGDELFVVSEVSEYSFFDREQKRLVNQELKLNNELKFIQNNEDINETMSISKSKSLSQLNDLINANKELYEKGVISLYEYDNLLEQRDQLRNEIQMQSFSDKTSDDTAALRITEIDFELLDIKYERSKLLNVQLEYSFLEDGVCKSKEPGIVLSVNNDKVIDSSEDILTYANLDDYKFIIKTSLINQEYFQKKDSISVVEINNKLSIEEIVLDYNEQELIAYCYAEPHLMKYYGKILTGKTVMEYESDMIVKKSTFGNIEIRAGDLVTIYRLNDDVTLLGQNYRVEAVKVEVLYVGDTEVGIKSNSLDVTDQIITNVSYKIRDGVRVQSWR